MSGGSSGPDALLQQVRETAEGYTVFGELGRNSDDDVWYLGRDGDAGPLTALRLRRTGGDASAPSYSLEIARELTSDVALGAGECHACRAPLRTYARFCGRCGADQASGGGLPSTPEERAHLLDQVRHAAQAGYEVLGEMPWADGAGIVYFAVERTGGQLVRLRLRREAEEMSLEETTALMPLRTTAGPVVAERTTGSRAPIGRPDSPKILMARSAPQPGATPPSTPAAETTAPAVRRRPIPSLRATGLVALGIVLGLAIAFVIFR